VIELQRRTTVRLSRLNTCLLAIALLGAATLANEASTRAQNQSLLPLKVGLLKIAGYTNIYAAQKENMFRDNGLEVTPVFFPSGSEIAAAAQSGAVDIIFSYPAAIMTADEHGFDYGITFQNEITYDKGPDTGAILAMKSSGIKSVNDLVGKRIAVSARESQATVAVDEVLRQHHIDPRQVKYLEAGYPSFYDMLRTKQVDAVASTEPFTTRIIASGIANVIAWHYAEAFPGGPLSSVAAKRSYIAQHQEVLDRVNRALKKSIDYMNADVERGRKLVVEFTGLDPTIVAKMVYCRYNYDVRLDKWRHLIKIVTDSGVLQKPHTPEDFFSPPIKPFIRG
jgi:NitT/TauT family transport system substrate-binding protein